MGRKRGLRQTRRTRSIRLSDSAWESLENLARLCKRSRGELLELMLNSNDVRLKAEIQRLSRGEQIEKALTFYGLSDHTKLNYSGDDEL